MLYFEKEPLDNIVINSATVYFSDGSQQQVNLGTIYQLAPKIYYINEKGEKWYIRGQSISYEPYEFKFLDIIKYLKVLEEI